MTRGWTRRDMLRRGGLATSIGLAGCVGSLTGPSPAERVRKHEEALRQLADIPTLVSEGYRTSGTYVRTDEGVLGIPFINPRITKLEPERPQAVLWGLTGDGQYEALGLKWFVPARDRDAPPSLFGKQFVGPRSGDTPLIPKHYALHVWLFRENPDGLFALYNPAVEPPALVDRIAPVRTALSDLFVGSKARKNGYRNTEMCITTDRGGYGVPFVKKDADGSGGTDPKDPPILIYRLTSNWTYRLMGAEWYVPASEVDETPSMFGQPFHGPMAGHSPKTNQPEHYGLHAWFFRANPRGMFDPFNPVITC